MHAAGLLVIVSVNILGSVDLLALRNVQRLGFWDSGLGLSVLVQTKESAATGIDRCA